MPNNKVEVVQSIGIRLLSVHKFVVSVVYRVSIGC